MPCPSSFGRSLEWGAFTSRWQNWSWMKSCLFQFLTRFIFKIKRDIFYVGVDQVFHPLTLSQQLILGQYFKIEVSSVLLRTRYVLNTQISLFKDIFLLTTVSGAQLRTWGCSSGWWQFPVCWGTPELATNVLCKSDRQVNDLVINCYVSY